MATQNPIETWAAHYSAFRAEFSTFESSWNNLQRKHSQELNRLEAERDNAVASIDGQLKSKIERISIETGHGISAAEKRLRQNLDNLADENPYLDVELSGEEELLRELKIRVDEEKARLGREKAIETSQITERVAPLLKQLDSQIQSIQSQIEAQKQPRTFFQKLLSLFGLWTAPDSPQLRTELLQAQSERGELMESQEVSYRDLDHRSAIEQSELLKFYRDSEKNIRLNGIDALRSIDAEFAKLQEKREADTRQFEQQKEEEKRRIQVDADAKQREAQILANHERLAKHAEYEQRKNHENQQHNEEEEAMKARFEGAYNAVKECEKALEYLFATAKSDSPIWDSLTSDATLPGTTSHFYLGTLTDSLQVDGYTKQVELKCCLPLFAPGHGQPNLVVTYDEATMEQAITLMNSLTGRALVSLPGSELNVIIGAYRPQEISSPLWQIPVSHRKFVPSPEYPEKDKFRSLLAELDKDTNIKGSHIQMRNVSNLFELNEALSKDGETLRFNLLLIYNILQDYLPHITIIADLMKTGPECGNSSIIGINSEQLERYLTESYNKQAWENFERSIKQTAQTIDLRDPTAIAPADLRLSVHSKIRLENSAGVHLEKAVQFVKKIHDKQERKILPLSEFIPKQENWWQEKALSGISIPFGKQKLSGKEVCLEFLDQQREFGAPHGLVAGGTGSGKSNFLGVLILNACLRYSPDELRLILIDIKGTEFSPFINTLPNVELITTDGDKELVKNIIEELKGKAAERRKIYDQTGFGEYRRFRENVPDKIFPRYLIIIDEASALFSGEHDDPIRSMLTAGVQEYRKFGFHFFFASQRFNNKFGTDLLAQCDLRISFNADSDTISFISPEHTSKLRGQKNESGHGAMLPKGQDPVQFLAYARGLDADGKEFNHTKRILDDLSDFAVKHNYKVDQTVYLGTQKAVFDKNENYQLLKQVKDNYPILLFGEPVGRRVHDVSDKLSNAAGNVFIGGGKETASARIIVGLIYSLLAQTKSRAIKIVIFNFFLKSEDERSGWQILQHHCSPFSDKLQIISEAKACSEYVQKTFEKIQNQEEDNFSNELIVLCFAGTENMNQVFGKNEATNPHAKMLRKIAEDGPSKGVFTIYQVLNVNGYSKFFGSRLNSGTFASAYFLHSCTYRIILQTSLEDSREWLENSKEAAFLGSYSDLVSQEIIEVNQSKAIFFNYSDNIQFKIKTYGILPKPSDFKHFFSL